MSDLIFRITIGTGVQMAGISHWMKIVNQRTFKRQNTRCSQVDFTRILTLTAFLSPPKIQNKNEYYDCYFFILNFKY